MSKITELRGQLDDRRTKLAKVFEEAGDDYDFSKVKSLEGDDTAAKAAGVKALNDEMTDLAKQLEELEGFEGMKAANEELGETKGTGMVFPAGGKKDEKKEVKSFGEQFTDSAAFKNKGTQSELSVDIKALLERATGWVPDPLLTNRFVDAQIGRIPLLVADLIPSTTTTANAVRYYLETAWTNAAIEVAEGTAKPEATLAVGNRTDNVEKIAVWIPVTDEQLADVAGVRQYLESRLGFMVRKRLDLQILVGNGTAPNISGITDRAGIQTQAKGADTTPDAIYKAITKIEVVDGSDPNAVVLHPNDWTPIRLLTTADGIYIWGPPMDAGPERIWGLRVVKTQAMTENTGLVGDFNQAMLFMREGLTVKTTDSHASYFVSNIQVVLVEIRVALAVFREAAFCTVTGI